MQESETRYEGESDEDVDSVAEPRVWTPMPTDVVNWYTMKVVRFELCKLLRNREMAFLNTAGDVCIRDLAGWNTSYLDYSMQAYHFYQRDYRIYRSVGSLPKIPLASFEQKQRKEDKEAIRLAWQGVKDYDFVIDLDAPSIAEAKRDALKITKFYQELSIPYWVQFSGNAGFHIVVDSRHTPPIEDKNRVCAKMAKMVYEMAGPKTMDPLIYDKRRVLKAPYSIDFKSGQPLVVLPLTDEQLKSFKVEDAKISNVSDPRKLGAKIYNRGILERPGSMTAATRLMEEALKI